MDTPQASFFFRNDKANGMQILQASFFFRNDKPNGIGFTLGPPDYTPASLHELLYGETTKQYMRDSDQALGTSIIQLYFSQLEALGKTLRKTGSLSPQEVFLAVFNILWLQERRFLVNDEFNGYQIVVADGEIPT